MSVLLLAVGAVARGQPSVHLLNHWRGVSGVDWAPGPLFLGGKELKLVVEEL